MRTDFRPSCAELIDELQQASDVLWNYGANKAARKAANAANRARAALTKPAACNYPSCVDDSPDERCSRWLTGECQGPNSGARAALAVEAVGPSDEELFEVADDSDMDRFEGERSYSDGTVIKEGCWEAWDHQLLAFAHAVLARYGTTPTPISVAERLPGPEDCDAGGQCWWWDTYYERWFLDKLEFVPRRTSRLWLPFHAIPRPEQAG